MSKSKVREIKPTQDGGFSESILSNIETTRALFARGEPAGIVGTVCGSEKAMAFWKRHLDSIMGSLRARETLSFHEDLPVGQALGILLLWQRLRPCLLESEGALIAFVFGEGTRAAPFTEAECGQKPAIRTFVVDQHSGSRRRYMSTVELAIRYFSGVESFLRRSGFKGIVVKWGDEIQIPTRPLNGSDPLFRDADIVRFVSMRRIEPEDSLQKDWVGVDESGKITAFIPRRPIQEMEKLADRGLVQRRKGQLFGGVNLGSIALSGAILDILLEEFRQDLQDRSVHRRDRPTLDPQLFTALCIAAIQDPVERSDAWNLAKSESPAIASLEDKMPDILDRLCRVIQRFTSLHERLPRIVAMDFGSQYWGDIGQHTKIREFYMGLLSDNVEGMIARNLAGVSQEPDENGNIISRCCRLGANLTVRNSVLTDARIEEGEISNSVIVGTRAASIQAQSAFDIGSYAPRIILREGAGAYRVLSSKPVEIAENHRAATVLLPKGEALLRVLEESELGNRSPSYQNPILDNSISFEEAHRLVENLDPAEVERRRAALENEIEREIFNDD